MATIKNPVTIVQGGSPTPTPVVEEKDINFYDYDGTLVESWTLAELANKTALPANPTHAGLTAQGWNWTLADLQSEGTKMNVGQMYMPTDGKTHLFLEIDPGHLTGRLGLGLNGTATVDWGDGSATETLTGTDITAGGVGATHTFAAAGTYEVTIDIPSGSEGNIRGARGTVSFLWYATNYQVSVTSEMLVIAHQLKRLWVGERLKIGVSSDGCFSNLGLECLTMPRNVTIGQSLLYACQFLKSFIVPDGVTSLPAYSFQNNYSLKTVSIPLSVIVLGERSFAGCGTLQSIAIPSSVSSLGEYTFATCNALEEISGAGGLLAIPESMCLECRNLVSFRVSPSVTSIGSSSFYTRSNSFWLLDCSICTSIPTADGNIVLEPTNGFTIKVPAALEASWKAAANWSTYANYIVGV